MNILKTNRRRFISGVGALVLASTTGATQKAAAKLPVCRSSYINGNWIDDITLYEAEKKGTPYDPFHRFTVNALEILFHAINTGERLYIPAPKSKSNFSLTTGLWVNWHDLLTRLDGVKWQKGEKDSKGRQQTMIARHNRLISKKNFIARYDLDGKSWLYDQNPFSYSRSNVKLNDLAAKIEKENIQTLGGELIDLEGKLTGEAGKPVMSIKTSLKGLPALYKVHQNLEQKLFQSYKAKKCKLEEPFECFLTTACCQTIGLPDDCFELETLRRFRDQVLINLPGGREEIETYYKIAPALINEVNARPNAQAVWLQSYYAYILPAAIMARLGLNKAAHSHYKKLLAFVKRRSLPAPLTK